MHSTHIKEAFQADTSKDPSEDHSNIDSPGFQLLCQGPTLMPIQNLDSTKVQKTPEQPLNKRASFQFQQPSFLKFLQSYLSENFSQIERQFLEINQRFDKLERNRGQLGINFKTFKQNHLLEKKGKQMSELKNVSMKTQSIKQNQFNDKKIPCTKDYKPLNNPENISIENKQSKFQQESFSIQKIDQNLRNKLETKENDLVGMKIKSLQQKVNIISTKFQSLQNRVQKMQIPGQHEQLRSIKVQKIKSIDQKKNTKEIQSKQEHHNQLQTLLKEQKNADFELMNKKMYHLSKSFTLLQTKVHQYIQKSSKPVQHYAFELQSLRNELSAYKAKRESTLAKLIANQHLSSPNTITKPSHPSKQHINPNNISPPLPPPSQLDSLSEKVHFLMISIQQLLPKYVFELEMEDVNEALVGVRKRLDGKVGFGDLGKFQTFEKFRMMKKGQMRVAGQKDQGEKENQTVGQSKQPEKQKKPQSEIEKNQSQRKSTENQPSEPENNDPTILPQQLIQIQAKLDSHEQFLKTMNKFYNEKLNVFQMRMDRIQKENMEKLLVNEIEMKSNVNLFIKSSEVMQQQFSQGQNLLTNKEQSQNPQQYNAKNHLNQKPLSSATHNKDSHINEESLPASQQIVHSLHQSKKSLLQPQQVYNFQFSTLKKKISKLNGKYELVSQDVHRFKQEIMKYFDMIQKNDQNKTDWESFKKAVKHFDEKIKQLENICNRIQSQTDLEQNSHAGLHGHDSSMAQIAAKKKWSCLFCDKQFKNYEGKTSQIRYLGVSSTRLKHEAPRAASYQKQSMRQKEYEKIFTNPLVNNENSKRDQLRRRKSSLNRSKDNTNNLTERMGLYEHNQHQNSHQRFTGFS